MCTRITVDRAIERARRPSRAARDRPVSWIGGASQGTRHSDTYSAFDASTSLECYLLICSYCYSKALYYYVWDVPRRSRDVCLLLRCYKTLGPSNQVNRKIVHSATNRISLFWLISRNVKLVVFLLVDETLTLNNKVSKLKRKYVASAKYALCLF